MDKINNMHSFILVDETDNSQVSEYTHLILLTGLGFYITEGWMKWTVGPGDQGLGEWHNIANMFTN